MDGYLDLKIFFSFLPFFPSFLPFIIVKTVPKNSTNDLGPSDECDKYR